MTPPFIPLILTYSIKSGYHILPLLPSSQKRILYDCNNPKRSTMLYVSVINITSMLLESINQKAPFLLFQAAIYVINLTYGHHLLIL